MDNFVMATLYNDMHQLSFYLSRLQSFFQKLINDLQNQIPYILTYNCHRKYTSTRGQPQLEISKRLVECLGELYFSLNRIAELLGISTKTLQRRRVEFQIDVEEFCSTISDVELRETMLY